MRDEKRQREFEAFCHSLPDIPMAECQECGAPIIEEDVFDDGTCRYCGGVAGSLETQK